MSLVCVSLDSIYVIRVCLAWRQHLKAELFHGKLPIVLSEPVSWVRIQGHPVGLLLSRHGQRVTNNYLPHQTRWITIIIVDYSYQNVPLADNRMFPGEWMTVG